MNADLSTHAPTTPESEPCVLPDPAESHAELAGTLSPDERRIGDAHGAPPSQDELDGAIATMLLTRVLYPEDYAHIPEYRLGGPPGAERENAYVNLRMAAGLALKVPTPGNRERLVEALFVVVRLAMCESARAVLASESDPRDYTCHGCGADVPNGTGTCAACRFAYAQGAM